jgi:hypothetical protein
MMQQNGFRSKKRSHWRQAAIDGDYLQGGGMDGWWWGGKMADGRLWLTAMPPCDD